LLRRDENIKSHHHEKPNKEPRAITALIKHNKK